MCLIIKMKESNELSNCQDKSHFQRFFFFFKKIITLSAHKSTVYTFIFKYNDNIMDSFYTGLKQVSFFLSFPSFSFSFPPCTVVKSGFLENSRGYYAFLIHVTPCQAQLLCFWMMEAEREK